MCERVSERFEVLEPRVFVKNWAIFNILWNLADTQKKFTNVKISPVFKDIFKLFFSLGCKFIWFYDWGNGDIDTIIVFEKIPILFPTKVYQVKMDLRVIIWELFWNFWRKVRKIDSRLFGTPWQQNAAPTLGGKKRPRPPWGPISICLYHPKCARAYFGNWNSKSV